MKEPALADVGAERARLVVSRALHGAGFAEVGTPWQRGTTVCSAEYEGELEVRFRACRKVHQAVTHTVA